MPKGLEKPAVLHVISIIKAGISAIPVYGGPIASLIGDYIPTASQRNAEKAVEYLRKELDRLAGRIDVDAINKDEFSELFMNCYEIIIKTHKEIKLHATARLLGNIFLKSGDPDKADFTELDHFTRCLENLSIGAIEVLGKVVRIAEQKKKKAGKVSNLDLVFMDDITNKLSNMDQDLIISLLHELSAANMIQFIYNPPGIRISRDTNFRLTITPMGYKFTKYILNPAQQTAQH